MSMSNNFKHNLHNSHSQTELLEMFWWASRWWIEGWASCRLSLREMLRGVRGVGWGLRFGLSHRNTKLNCWKFTKTLKSLQRYCHAIYMLTQLRRQCQFLGGGGGFFLSMFRSGSVRVQLLLAEDWTFFYLFNPFASFVSWQLQPESAIKVPTRSLSNNILLWCLHHISLKKQAKHKK